MENDSRTHLLEENNSIISGFLKEWNVFWDNLIQKKDEKFEVKLASPLEDLSHEEIKTLIKSLSAQRKQLNLKLERIQKEIDLNTIKIDTLKLVGSSSDDTQAKLEELMDLGQNLTNELDRLNHQLAVARKRDEELIANLKLGQGLPDITD